MNISEFNQTWTGTPSKTLSSNQLIIRSHSVEPRHAHGMLMTWEDNSSADPRFTKKTPKNCNLNVIEYIWNDQGLVHLIFVITMCKTSSYTNSSQVRELLCSPLVSHCWQRTCIPFPGWTHWKSEAGLCNSKYKTSFKDKNVGHGRHLPPEMTSVEPQL